MLGLHLIHPIVRDESWEKTCAVNAAARSQHPVNHVSRALEEPSRRCRKLSLFKSLCLMPVLFFLQAQTSRSELSITLVNFAAFFLIPCPTSNLNYIILKPYKWNTMVHTIQLRTFGLSDHLCGFMQLWLNLYSLPATAEFLGSFWLGL